nr:MAG TPA: hypothetical protein [Caudoviricetes sp.]
MFCARRRIVPNADVIIKNGVFGFGDGLVHRGSPWYKIRERMRSIRGV